MHSIFVNETLTLRYRKIEFHCPELKRNGGIDKTYSRDGIVQNVCKKNENRENIKIMHMNTLCDRFPDLDSGKDAGADHSNSLQSSY